MGDPAAQDSEIISYALKNNCTVLTCDLDFSTILSLTHGCKPSVIQLRMQGLEVCATAEVIAAVVAQYKAELNRGAIVTIDAKRARVRILPLGD